MKTTNEYKNLMEYQREHPDMSEGPEDVAPIVTPKEVDNGSEPNRRAQRGSQRDRL